MHSLILAALGIALSLGVAAQASAQTPKIPDTPAGKRLAGWLTTINSGKPENVRKFVEVNYDANALKEISLHERAARHLDILDQTRGLELRRVEKVTETEAVVLLQTKLSEEWRQVALQVAEREPHGILGLRFAPAGVPAELRQRGRLSDTEIARRLDTLVSKLAAADVFSGAVLVAKDGKVLYKRACGLASRAWNASNRTDTKFNLGSMNKMFTAVAIAQLAEQGKLSFNDSIGKHLTDYPNPEAARKVTIHHLLTHTSGIGDYFNDKFIQASRDRFRAIADYFPLFVNEPLEFEPGKQFRYSNAGFLVLGAIVQKVSGQDYFDYVREHIYKPAGMIHTDAYELDRDIPNLAVGYTREGMDGSRTAGERRNNIFMHVIKGGPAGGGYSTVEDLARFAQALRSHKLLSAQSTDLLLTGKTAAMGPTSKYGYGFIETTLEAHRIVGHSGGFPGINSNLDMYLDNGYTVAAMSNYDTGTQILTNKLREWILQE